MEDKNGTLVSLFDEPVKETPKPQPVDPTPPPVPPVMDTTALVFLDDPTARKLAVAWVTCKGVEAEWLKAAGLPVTSQIRALQSALKMNKICRDGGVTDDLAMRYISTLVAEPLHRMKNRRKE